MTVPGKENTNTKLTINEPCGDVDGKSVRSACCMKLGRFVTIQAKSTEQETLEIGKILVHVTAPYCSEADKEKDLCALFNDADDYDEAQFNDDRNDGSCIPTTTSTTTSTTSTSTTSTTTLCDPTPLRGALEGMLLFR